MNNGKNIDLFFYTYSEITRKYRNLNIPHESHLNNDQILESFKTFQKKQPENLKIPRTILEKSSILLYELIRKKISVTEGNKISIIFFLLYLYQNGYWLNIPINEFYNLIKWIKISNSKVRKLTIKSIEKIINNYMIKI